uniref:Uncharacterized protein n=1 Tax=Rhizophora mucronata TaxID=61149 RepID=A0A2P2ME54_RHIMU
MVTCCCLKYKNNMVKNYISSLFKNKYKEQSLEIQWPYVCFSLQCMDYCTYRNCIYIKSS